MLHFSNQSVIFPDFGSLVDQNLFFPFKNGDGAKLEPNLDWEPDYFSRSQSIFHGARFLESGSRGANLATLTRNVTTLVEVASF